MAASALSSAESTAAVLQQAIQLSQSSRYPSRSAEEDGKHVEQAKLLPGAHDSRLAVDVHSRLWLLSSAAGQATLRFIDVKALKLKGQAPAKDVVCQPPLPAASSALCFNANGSYLAVTSAHSCHVLRLPKPGLEAGLLDRSASLKCRTFPVGDFFHSSNSTLFITQVAWHPASDSHLAVLTSDSRLRVYNVARSPSTPEQEFDLEFSLAAAVPGYADFCFGPPHGWDQFSVYLLAADGQMCLLSPIVPYGSSVSAESVKAVYQREAQAQRDAGDHPEQLTQIRARLLWLQETFSLDRDEAATLKVWQASPVLSSVVARGLVQGPLSLQHATVAAAHDPEPQATSLLCLRGSPTRLLRAFSGGQVDVLVGLQPVAPLFPFAEAASLPFPLDQSLFLFDRIITSRPHAGERPRLHADASDPTVVFSQTSEVQLLRMPWLQDISKLYQAQSGGDDDGKASSPFEARVSAFMGSMRSECSRVALPLSREPVVGAQVISDAVLGRYCVMLFADRVVQVGPIPRHRPVSVEEAPLAIDSDRDKEHKDQKDGMAHAYELLGVQPFETVIAKFLDDYRAFRLEQPASLRLDSSESLKKFFKVRDYYYVVCQDLKKLQKEILQRLTLLRDITAKQEELFANVEDDVIALMRNNEFIQKALLLHTQLQETLTGRVREIVDQASVAQSDLSEAERQFQQEVLTSLTEAKGRQAKAAELEAKTARLTEVSTQLRDAEAGGQLSRAQNAQIQPAMIDQTRAIDGMMGSIRELRARLGGVLRSLNPSGAPVARAQHSEDSDGDGFGSPARLLGSGTRGGGGSGSGARGEHAAVGSGHKLDKSGSGAGDDGVATGGDLLYSSARTPATVGPRSGGDSKRRYQDDDREAKAAEEQFMTPARARNASDHGSGFGSGSASVSGSGSESGSGRGLDGRPPSSGSRTPLVTPAPAGRGFR